MYVSIKWRYRDRLTRTPLYSMCGVITHPIPVFPTSEHWCVIVHVNVITLPSHVVNEVLIYLIPHFRKWYGCWADRFRASLYSRPLSQENVYWWRPCPWHPNIWGQVETVKGDIPTVLGSVCVSQYHICTSTTITTVILFIDNIFYIHIRNAFFSGCFLISMELCQTIECMRITTCLKSSVGIWPDKSPPPPPPPPPPPHTHTPKHS